MAKKHQNEPKIEVDQVFDSIKVEECKEIIDKCDLVIAKIKTKKSTK